MESGILNQLLGSIVITLIMAGKQLETGNVAGKKGLDDFLIDTVIIPSMIRTW